MIIQNNKDKKSAFSLIELSIVLIVIGFLVSGVIAGKKLIDSAKLASARSATKSSIVPQIEDLVLWLDAASEESVLNENGNIATNGEAIEQWLDINPQKDLENNAIRDEADNVLAENDNRPTYNKTGFNGLPALEFDGINDSMEFSTTAFLRQPSTIFFVAQDYDNDGSSTEDYGILLNQSGSLTIRYWNNGSLQLLASGDTNSNALGGSTTSDRNSPILVSGTFQEGAASTIQINAHNKKSPNTNLDGFNNNSTTSIVLSSHASQNASWQGFMAEIIIYDRVLSDSEIEAVRAYLNNKWSVY